ncbi:PRTRC system protein A [Candidatus Manganitrophus noduliformans]|uniref:PRTRC system protein A n=1 Tax=Candidatus Manganitrophus noduliformans TaxID=2606439 RepID=A0A7X6IAB1_9BACT|nr:PRTRC system protein A [Candidatus Manganitrophus noduliformans]NKE70225.1 PRTRC system protein A [Candidatus Manganitrophus noduliformans]
MNAKDEILQTRLPTVMVPVFEPLPVLKAGETRLLMAEDGLWIEAEGDFGHFRRPLWKSRRKLPYGQVEIASELRCGPIPRKLVERFAELANEWTEWGCETAAWITWGPNVGWELLEPEILIRAAVSVRYTWPDLGPDTALVVDLHSHGIGSAFFSPTDDQSDLGFPHYSLVLGRCGRGRPLTQLDCKLRLCLAGYYFDELVPWIHT